MARPFKKQGGTATLVRQYWCENCEEWENEHGFTSHDVYSVDNHFGEWQGEVFYTDYTSWTAWVHDSCDEIVSVDERPKQRTSAEVWVCGDCKAEHFDADEAQECCE